MTPRAHERRFDLPNLGIGVGLRTVHYGHVIDKRPKVDWLEIISENFMGTGGRPERVLEQVAELYPIVMHGVSMSIGSTDPIDRAYFAELARVAKLCRAVWVSDHLCFTGVGGKNVHDLLPMPYTESALRHTIARVKAVQDILERPLVLENPSSYVQFKSTTMSEHEFLGRLAVEADCGLLLDVNNVWVSSQNHRFDPFEYVESVPHDRIVQFHVAGHTDKGTHLLDTHIGPTIEVVWKLLERACELTGGRSVLYEWDEEIPAFEVITKEAETARKFTGMQKKKERARVRA